MRNALPWVFGAWIFAALPVFAQSPPAAPVDQPATEVPVVPSIQSAPVVDTFKYWVRTEYLAYWVKNTPLPISLVTGDPNNPTQELLNSDRNLGMFSGFRVAFGIWLDPYNNLGLESSAFSLQRRTTSYSASSDGTGSPTLAFPFTMLSPGAVGDMLMPITSPGQFAGNVVISSSLQLWGAELNTGLSLVHTGEFEITGLVGLRFVDLQENLNINTLSADIATNPSTVLVQSDQFNTRNQFYGGQIGGRFNWQGERFAVDLTGKLALGANRQTIDIQGYSTQGGPGGINGTFPGGFFTQQSNMGHFSATQFAVIPSIEMKFHVIINQYLRAFVGYDFMYWNSVVRPGSQIDRNINLTQSAIFGNGALSGPASPMPLFNRTDFWAQGITVGLEFRF
jgi:hypothetical protein